jgi:hypothetical protein
VALPACPEPVEGRPSALRLLITWEPIEEPYQAPGTHFPDEPYIQESDEFFRQNPEVKTAGELSMTIDTRPPVLFF